MKKTLFITIGCVIVIIGIIGVSVAAMTNKQPEEMTNPDLTEDNLTENDIVEMEENLQAEVVSEPEFSIFMADPNEEITQEILYNRMLNTVDFFECVSIEYKTKTRADDIEHTESIDSDIPKHISYTTFYDETNQMEGYCDGKDMYVYYLHNKEKDYFGKPHLRTESEMELLATTPRHSINEIDGYDEWVYRNDLTNSIRSDDTIFPQGPAFLYLSDFDKWSVIGETDYLGRKCVELEGSLSDFAGTKFKSNSFYMCVDKLTGILLKLECYDEDGEIKRYTTVSKITIDHPEITDSKIEAGIEKCQALPY